MGFLFMLLPASESIRIGLAETQTLQGNQCGQEPVVCGPANILRCDSVYSITWEDQDKAFVAHPFCCIRYYEEPK